MEKLRFYQISYLILKSAPTLTYICLYLLKDFSRSHIQCDEGVMIDWLQKDEDSNFNNPPTPDSDGKLLFVEIHRGQQNLKIKGIFKNM